MAEKEVIFHIYVSMKPGVDLSEETNKGYI